MSGLPGHDALEGWALSHENSVFLLGESPQDNAGAFPLPTKSCGLSHHLFLIMVQIRPKSFLNPKPSADRGWRIIGHHDKFYLI